MPHGYAIPITPILSRLASNTTALGNQRGFFTRLSSLRTEEDSGYYDPIHHTFSGPTQRHVSGRMTERFNDLEDSSEMEGIELCHSPLTPIPHVSCSASP
jgi:hypothetical protein